MHSDCSHPASKPPSPPSQNTPPIPVLPPTYTGEQRRDEGVARIAAARKAHVIRLCRTMLLILLRQQEATADDLRAEYVLPAGVHPNIVGAAFQKLKRAGLIRMTGMEISQRAARHAGINRVWTLTDRIGAEHWLAQNPEPTEPEV